MNPFLRPGEFPVQSKRTRDLDRPGIYGLALVVGLLLLAAGGCAHRQTAKIPARNPFPVPAPRPAVEGQPPAPGEYVEDGVASWYGIPFNGHRTSNGEIYDMYQFTAAHRTLPFGAIVRVRNQLNGKETEVRINDRGPFVANRIIDLSLAAAQAIEMVGTGTAPVRIEVIAGPNPEEGFFAVQVGAFLLEENAQRLKAQLAAQFSPVSIATYDLPSGIFYRVRVGRLPSEDAARQLARQLHSAGQLTTFVVRLDEVLPVSPK